MYILLMSCQPTAVLFLCQFFFESVEKRNAVKKSLINAQIYCPVHWPKNRLVTPDMRVNGIFDTELSLICDQRYTEYDMEEIIKVINKLN